MPAQRCEQFCPDQPVEGVRGTGEEDLCLVEWTGLIAGRLQEQDIVELDIAVRPFPDVRGIGFERGRYIVAGKVVEILTEC
jgi:hypothetical protein